jgi:uncharacterized protein (TIGR03089 family)
MSSATIPGLLARLVAADPSRPLITFYDDSRDERTELSVLSFENWVAKTANLLRDGVAAEPGAQVAIALPTHWQGAVWLCAAWSCGLVVGLSEAALAEADYAVVGPDLPPTGAETTFALSLQPLGAGFHEPLPAGVVDYALEVPAYGDVFAAGPSVAGELPALRTEQGDLTHADLLARAAEVETGLALGAAPRLLTDENPCSDPGWATALLAPLVAGGSVVLVRDPDPARELARMEQERVTATFLGGAGTPGAAGQAAPR